MKANDELRTGVITLLELKRQVDRVDHDIKVCLLKLVYLLCKVVKNEDTESIGYAARRVSGGSVCVFYLLITIVSGKTTFKFYSCQEAIDEYANAMMIKKFHEYFENTSEQFVPLNNISFLCKTYPNPNEFVKAVSICTPRLATRAT